MKRRIIQGILMLTLFSIPLTTQARPRYCNWESNGCDVHAHDGNGSWTIVTYCGDSHVVTTGSGSFDAPSGAECNSWD